MGMAGSHPSTTYNPVQVSLFHPFYYIMSFFLHATKIMGYCYTFRFIPNAVHTVISRLPPVLL